MESELFDFLRHIRPRVATTTYRRKSWMAQAFVRHLAATGKHYAEVKQAEVEAFLRSRGVTRQYRQAVCCAVRELFDFLKVRQNPAEKIVFKPDRSRRLPKVPSQAAVEKLIERLSDNGSDLRIRDRLMAELAYGSGLRRCELARLNVEDLDLEDGTAAVTGKGNKCRMVPLTSRTAAVIREYLMRRRAARGPLLVSFMGRRLSVTGVYEIMRSRVGIRPHLLRHACAAHMLANGANIRIIQELLGHADLASTQIYTQLEISSLREVVTAKHPRAKISEK